MNNEEGETRRCGNGVTADFGLEVSDVELETRRRRARAMKLVRRELPP
jgi:hypothetical protein